MNTYFTVLYFTVLKIGKRGKYRIRKTQSINVDLDSGFCLVDFLCILFIMIIILRNKFPKVWEKISKKFFEIDLSVGLSRILEYSWTHIKDINKLCDSQLLKIPNWFITAAAINIKNYKVFLTMQSSIFTFLSRK